MKISSVRMLSRAVPHPGHGRGGREAAKPRERNKSPRRFGGGDAHLFGVHFTVAGVGLSGRASLSDLGEGWAPLVAGRGGGEGITNCPVLDSRRDEGSIRRMRGEE